MMYARPTVSALLILAALLSLLADGGPAHASFTLSLDVNGGPSFTVQQAFPTSVDVIDFPPAEEEPLVIYGALTNTGTDDFIGIPSSTLFSTTPESSFFLSGVTAVIDGKTISEGDGLQDLPASPPFIGGFVLAPGETRVFVLHVIYGLLCPGCEGIPGPLLVPAPIGEVLTITGSSLDIRLGEVIDGVIVADPDAPPEIRIFANPSAFPLTVTVIPNLIEVSLDIKPASDPNSIRPRSRGKMPVAILSSADFDAPSELDQASLTFGRSGDEESLAFCTKSAEDVNGDGLLDQVCHFHTQDTGFQCGDVEGVLRGDTLDGVPIEGNDSVRIVPCR